MQDSLANPQTLKGPAIKVCSHCKGVENQPHQICKFELLTVHLHRIQWIAMPLSTYLSVLLLANHPAICKTHTMSKPKSLFFSVPPSSPFIQVLCWWLHWITVSNIGILNGSQRSDSVVVYDSATVARVFGCKACNTRTWADTLHFGLVNVHLQPNGWGCGLFAIVLLALSIYS